MGIETLISVIGVAATVVIATMGLVAFVYRRLGGLESDVKNIGERLDARIDGLEARMDRFESQLNEIVGLMKEHIGYHRGIEEAPLPSDD